MTVEAPATDVPDTKYAPSLQKSDSLNGNELLAKDPETPEERNIEIWEGLNRRKYAVDYFNVRETAEEFMVKMPVAEINKFIMAELKSRDYAMTVDNYKSLLAEIEGEIGSDKLELFKRFNKLTGYIRAINKLNKAKELKEKYKIE
jgi:hypothetical protein